MISPTKLSGSDLVECARANAKQGIKIAAYQCGYGDDITNFTEQLKSACQIMNLTVTELNQLITDQDIILQQGTGEIFAPETESEL
ncbi:MAG: hypothetical protein EAZ87_01865 [Nostocales cyanobacterium]|nr:MAG: hypothetical protein EAZ87_01865 [Nostocales cyanobacterium]